MVDSEVRVTLDNDDGEGEARGLCIWSAARHTRSTVESIIRRDFCPVSTVIHDDKLTSTNKAPRVLVDYCSL